jgi:hypothetical protein
MKLNIFTIDFRIYTKVIAYIPLEEAKLKVSEKN